MSPPPLEFHPDAIAEARAAREWYEKRSPAAVEAFMAELERAVDLIRSSPQRWRVGRKSSPAPLSHPQSSIEN